MMRIIIFFIILTVYITSPAQNSVKSGFYIDGEITGLYNNAILLEYNSVNGCLKKDTANIKNGKFHFKGPIPEPTIARLYGNINSPSLFDNFHASFFLENKPLTINIKMDHFKDIKVTGSTTQHEVSALFLKENDLLNKIPSIDKESNKLSIKSAMKPIQTT